jgi:hypothetical protein
MASAGDTLPIPDFIVFAPNESTRRRMTWSAFERLVARTGYTGHGTSRFAVRADPLLAADRCLQQRYLSHSTLALIGIEAFDAVLDVTEPMGMEWRR